MELSAVRGHFRVSICEIVVRVDQEMSSPPLKVSYKRIYLHPW